MLLGKREFATNDVWWLLGVLLLFILLPALVYSHCCCIAERCRNSSVEDNDLELGFDAFDASEQDLSDSELDESEDNSYRPILGMVHSGGRPNYGTTIATESLAATPAKNRCVIL